METEEWEKTALRMHKKVVHDFNVGKHGNKGALLGEGRVHARIAMHLLETGGGLTSDEILADVQATKGKEWGKDGASDGPLDINSILDYMVSPGRGLDKIFITSGGQSFMDYNLISKLDEQNVLVKRGDVYFLWCQNGIDLGAKLATAKEKIEKANAEADSIDERKKEVKANEEKVLAIESELNGLGFFKFSEKKRVKEKLMAANEALSSAKASLQSAENAKSSIPTLNKEYQAIREECKKQLA